MGLNVCANLSTFFFWFPNKRRSLVINRTNNSFQDKKWAKNDAKSQSNPHEPCIRDTLPSCSETIEKKKKNYVINFIMHIHFIWSVSLLCVGVIYSCFSFPCLFCSSESVWDKVKKMYPRVYNSWHYWMYEKKHCIFYTRFIQLMDVGHVVAYSSCNWATGRVHPGQVTAYHRA